MRNQMKRCLLVVLLLALWVSSLRAGTAEEWMECWATAPFANNGQSVPNFQGATIRQVIPVRREGRSIRIRFTNEFGIEPLKIDKVSVALSSGGSAIMQATSHPVTFNGQESVVIPAGSILVSDEVALAVTAQTELSISMLLPVQQISVSTFHGFAGAVNYLEKGDAVSATDLSGATEIKSWYFLKGVEVPVTQATERAIVTLGDSITDGVGSSMNKNNRWPDVLSRRLAKLNQGTSIAVLNEGIGANRVLRDGTGLSALGRFDRDVLSHARVKYLIFLEGINDIGRLARNNDPNDEVTAEDLELAFEQFALRAHSNGIKIIAGTITPYRRAGYFTEKGEAVRKQVNDWLRTSKLFDGIADFDKAVRDPAHPDALLAQYDSGDHLHPNDAGYTAMGEAIPLALFTVTTSPQ